jgi:predicted MPP superfamily phosphohydrolase
MRLRQWILFLFFVVTLLTLLHGFIAAHFWPLLPQGISRTVFLLAFAFLAFSYVAGRFLEFSQPRLALAFLHIGSWWLGMMSYLVLGCLVLDVVVLLDQILPLLPDQPGSLVFWLRVYFIVLGGVIIVVLVLGQLNVSFPRIRHLHLDSPVSLRMIVMPDLHLSGLVSGRRVERVVSTIRDQNPDLILLPGDSIDEDLARSPRCDPFRSVLRTLNAPLGVFAVTGNHEWISGADSSVAWLESCGIRVLRDETVDLGKVVLAGREDAASSRMGGKASVALAHILKDTDRSKPLILLDHQPSRIPEAVKNEVDILFCGHTHHGQFWPFQWLTMLLFPLSHGYRRFDKTDVYVSCGVGGMGTAGANQQPQ